MFEPRRPPLHDMHEELGCRTVDADGWDMPLEFAGVFSEYRAWRTASVVWDASNLGSIRVSGPGARDVIQQTFTNDLRRLGIGRCQYSLLLDDEDASIVDDVMVWWVRADVFHLTVNRPAAVSLALRSVRDSGDSGRSCVIEDDSADRVLLAVQGARARDSMAEISPAAAAMPPFHVCEAELPGGAGLLTTTRFGGRQGYELHLAAPAGRAVYRRLIGHGVKPAGLAMRETHRLESGIPRHGCELRPTITPIEAGLSHVVGFYSAFLGRAALLRRRRIGVDRTLRAIVLNGRQIPRCDDDVLLDGRRIGHVTSGTFSLGLRRGLALAYLRPEAEPGSTVMVRTAGGIAEGAVSTVPIHPRADRTGCS